MSFNHSDGILSKHLDGRLHITGQPCYIHLNKNTSSSTHAGGITTWPLTMQSQPAAYVIPLCFCPQTGPLMYVWTLGMLISCTNNFLRSRTLLEDWGSWWSRRRSRANSEQTCFNGILHSDTGEIASLAKCHVLNEVFSYVGQVPTYYTSSSQAKWQWQCDIIPTAIKQTLIYTMRTGGAQISKSALWAVHNTDTCAIYCLDQTGFYQLPFMLAPLVCII